MDEISPLLGNQPQHGSDLPSPNLRPRHQELIPTPCGPIKPWSELPRLLQGYFCFAILSLLALLGLTVFSLYKQHTDTDVSDEDNFTVSLIQLVGIVFCIYYITRGVLQENRQELVAFVLSVLVVMIRSVVNFSVLGTKGQQELLVRFVCIVTLGVVHIFCTTLLIRRPNMMAFRVGGALECLQEQYFLLNLCFSMVTFDLQAQLCLCVLILTTSLATAGANNIIVGVGVFWAILTTVVGAVAVLKEKKVLVWIFMVQNVPQVAFFVYLMYTCLHTTSDKTSGPRKQLHAVGLTHRDADSGAHMKSAKIITQHVFLYFHVLYTVRMLMCFWLQQCPCLQNLNEF
ncbi:unnamed protein product [Oreochromis niloticus]|nr:unnamed protein product [Mustela putorius furo]